MIGQKRPAWILAAALALGIFLFQSGCVPGTGAGFSYPQATEAAAQKTVSYLATQFQQNGTPAPHSSSPASAATPSHTPAGVTPTGVGTVMAYPTLLMQPTVASATPTAAPQNTCDVAGYLADVTISDGMLIPAGTHFTKTWRLANYGSCTWTPDYHLVFVSGEAMTAQTSVPLSNRDVPPGGVIEVSVDMKAPAAEGEHAGFWKLENANGERFGITGEGKAIWVRILVGDLPKTPLTVTSVKVFPEYTGWSGVCGKGHRANFSAIITASNAGRVYYHWTEKSDKLDDTVQKLDFAGPGSMTVTSSFDFTKPYYEGFVTITIDQPNSQTFDKVRYTITCTDK